MYQPAFLLIKEETLAQMFSCEFCEIYQKNFFIEHLRWLLLKGRQVPHRNKISRNMSFKFQVIISNIPCYI